MGHAARGAFADIGKQGYLTGVLGALTGGSVALGGAMLGLAEKSSEVGASIHEAALKTGFGAEQLSGLRAVAIETGGNFDTLTVALARAGANLQSAIIDPSGEAGKVLSQLLGGTKALAAEGVKPMGTAFQDVIKHILEMNNVGATELRAVEASGKGWQDNIEVFKYLAENGFKPMEEEAKKLGRLFTDLSALQAAEFQATIEGHHQSSPGAGLVARAGSDAVGEVFHRRNSRADSVPRGRGPRFFGSHVCGRGTFDDTRDALESRRH